MFSRTKIIASRCSNIVSKGAYSTGEKWELLSAVCVERKPVIAPPMTEIEKLFYEQSQQMEFENSHKSLHEIRHANDLKHIEQLKKGDVDVDVSVTQTAQDFVDASLEELNSFKPADTITEDDKRGNLKTTNRKLDKHLVLLTQQTLGDKRHYLLPQGMRQEGETMRQTADRILKETVGDDVKAQIYGNAPAGFYKYKYPKPIQEKTNATGAKVFIYFARHKQGDLSEKVDHKWLDRTELASELPLKYKKSLEFLIDE